MSTAEPPPFTLSANLSGHSQDVRGVIFPRRDIVLSCSRDSTSRSWTPATPESSMWKESVLYQNPGSGFVNSIAYLKEGAQGYLVSGGQDATINIWNLNPAPSEPYEPRFSLVGHQANVCCLNVSGETIVSGSWDCTAIVWRNHKSIRTLAGHSAAVWAVLIVEEHSDSDDQILTGAADNLIKLWKGAKEHRVFKGHTQAVRALTRIPTDKKIFASAGNDASVRLWTLSGQALHVFDGHDSFVYSLACLPSGELVSSGEDRSVRIWDPSAEARGLKQTLTIPAISVWAVAVCPESGDLVCGSSDSQVRIFTRERSRYADPATIAQFEESVRASTLPSATVGDIKKSDLPGSEALSKPGQKEGQVLMVKNSTTGAVEAHQWNSAKSEWEMIGTVVDGVGSSRKQLYEGKEYDYVFDVDIKDGAPPLKLPYNAAENPFTVAQRWLAKNELPDSYVDQVVAFIDKNTGGVSLGTSTSGDPYTGGGAYKPGNKSPQPPPQGGGDPWTGSGSKSTPTKAHLPHKTSFSFTQANLSAVRGKLDQFNSEMADKALSAEELKQLDALIQFLDQPQGIPPTSSAELLNRCLSEWPPEKQFPAFDLLRLYFLHDVSESSLPLLLGGALASSTSPSKVNETNGMLALRALVNGFASTIGKQVMSQSSDSIIEGIAMGAETGQSKNGKVAYATLLLNFSILSLQDELKLDDASTYLNCITKSIGDSDSEVVYRSLVAFGNLMMSKKLVGSLSVASLQKVQSYAAQASTRFSETRIKEVWQEIQKLT